MHNNGLQILHTEHTTVFQMSALRSSSHPSGASNGAGTSQLDRYQQLPFSFQFSTQNTQENKCEAVCPTASAAMELEGPVFTQQKNIENMVSEHERVLSKFLSKTNEILKGDENTLWKTLLEEIAEMPKTNEETEGNDLLPLASHYLFSGKNVKYICHLNANSFHNNINKNEIEMFSYPTMLI